MNHFCQQASRLASDRLERRLSLKETLRLNIHCLICSSCRHYADALRLLHATLRKAHEVEPAQELPAATRQYIIRQCQEQPE